MAPRRPSLLMARLSSSAARFGVLHRQRSDPHEARGMRGDDAWRSGRSGSPRWRASARLLVVEIGLRRGRQHVHIDAGCIHVAQPARNVETAGRKRPVEHVPPTSSAATRRHPASWSPEPWALPCSAARRFPGSGCGCGCRSCARLSFRPLKTVRRRRSGAPECRRRERTQALSRPAHSAIKEPHKHVHLDPP